jgi:ATP-dependent Clp protease ATP-binding subunit ClpC
MDKREDSNKHNSDKHSEPLLSYLSLENLKEPALTADVLRVLVLANDQARQLQHKRSGPEHILLGLILEGGAASQDLASVGLDYQKAKEIVIDTADDVKIEPKQKPMLSKFLDAILIMFRQRPFSNDAWMLMHASIEEANKLNSPETTSEHILLALLNQSDTDAKNNLHRFGLDSGELRRRVLQNLATEKAIENI